MNDEPTRPIRREDLIPPGQQGAPYPGPPLRPGTAPGPMGTGQLAPAGPPTGPPAPAAPAAPNIGAVLVAAALAALVSVGIGVYGRYHEATFFAFNIAGFSSGVAAKAWLATLAFVLALVQLGSAFVMYRGSSPAPAWISPLHRWSGRAAVIISVPVAVHCLYALGFQPAEPRTLIHSLFGCFFYGAFVAKMLLLTRKGTPGWTLPLFGGAVFTALTALWLTSSVWFFATSGITF
ncbi:DUF6529 family protein [Pseudonocardia sp. GCM10023141]|uniref:DUF6529 family protein n=1 Tax=Pseudonocardia sp. GCM10023141 TaxID=3252653 RepID=UPI003606794F